MKQMFSSTLRTSGMTAVELVVAVGIIGLLVVSLSMFQRSVLSFQSTLQSQLATQDDARRLLKTFSAELRAAATSSTGSYPLSKATGNEIVFFSDVDGDGLVEQIRYSVSGTTLTRGIVKPTGNPPQYIGSTETFRTLLSDVTPANAAIFSYYDSTYSGTSSPLSSPVVLTSVRLVKITVTTDHDPARPPAPLTLSTQITLRNVKDNL